MFGQNLNSGYLTIKVAISQHVITVGQRDERYMFSLENWAEMRRKKSGEYFGASMEGKMLCHLPGSTFPVEEEKKPRRPTV